MVCLIFKGAILTLEITTDVYLRNTYKPVEENHVNNMNLMKALNSVPDLAPHVVEQVRVAYH